MSDRELTTQLGPELPGLTCLEFLGSGGYADVYLYERERPRTRVAVKLMRADAMDEAKRRQFAVEADLMAELADHPFIVSVLDAGTAPDGRPYLVMQYYQSSTLATRIAANPLSVPDALRYGVQLSSAIETAHRANVIHRDIKPSNILLDLYDQPGLSDFGIAGRPSGDDDSDDEIGVSIPWSPPEVLSGESNGSVTSDVYSLAATVWTLLVGRAPFEIPGGDNSRRAMASRILHNRPPATGRGDVPASLDRLLQQALAKKPAYRPQSALELARNFQRVEQELRLARTEIALLDQDAAPGRGGVPGSATSTSLAIQPPSDSHNSQTTPEATSFSREGAHRADATERKAPRRVANTQPFPQPSPPPAPATAGSLSSHDPRASQATTRRPTLAAAEPQQEPATATHTGQPRLLAGAGAVAVLAVVIVAIAVLGQGKAHTSTAAAKGAVTSQQTDTAPGDALPNTTAPTDPTPVKATVSGNNVVFSWPAVAGVSQYSWSIAGGATHITTGTEVKLLLPASGTVCITVHSVQPGSPVSEGTHRCAK